MLIVVLQYLGGIGNQTNLYNETIYCLVRVARCQIKLGHCRSMSRVFYALLPTFSA